MRHKIKALIAVGMAAAVLTACSGGRHGDEGQRADRFGDRPGRAALPFRGRTAQPAPKDSVIVVMGPTSEPEARFRSGLRLGRRGSTFTSR